MKIALLTLICSLLTGCSFAVNMVLFNNSGSEIEICNVNNPQAKCIKIANNEMGIVSSINKMRSDSWKYSINGKVYSFLFGKYPEHASNVYCEGIIQKRCDIPLQIESTGLLFWAGKDSVLPVKSFPNQPKGFPVEPNA